ncbi:MAG: DUF4476 domain-containing protein [Chitinophagaceae bacterium]|nr:DUF4476 domain-containing protein [Chitinophagaceae bacterium]
MKKIILFLLLVLSFTAGAQPHRGAIQVRLKDNKMLTIVLDGRHFKKYGRSITVADLPQGMHDLKVYYFYPAHDAAYRSFRDNRSHAVLVYKGRLQVSGGIMYYLVADPVYKTLARRESRTVFMDDNEESYPISTETVFSDEHDNNSYNDKDNWDQNRRDNRNKVLSYYRENDRMSRAQMNTLKSIVDDRMGSDDKTAAIHQYTSDKSLTTDQVVEMMNWLSFESSKLQVAKDCYDRVLDKENYHEISMALSFQSSKRELDEFIAGNRAERRERYNEDDRYRPGSARGDRSGNGPLQQSEFSSLGRSVADRTGDADKQNLMQQYLAGRTMTTAQVSAMLDWLSFEGTKLEFARWAFDKTSDRSNFGQLKNKFSFSNSKRTIDDLVLKND